MPGVLTIARLQADCEIAGAPERATGVADRTDSALRSHLPENLRRAFAGWFDGDDDSIWIVRRLEASVVLAADAPPDEIAAALTTAIARALTAALRGSGDGATTLRFDDRTAYLSQFVVDTAAGGAWSRWYYAPFAGLRLLPPSAAIRTVLAADPTRGLASLARLDDHLLARVASALGLEDEMQLLQAFAGARPTDVHESGDVYAAAWSGWMRALHSHLARGHALFAFVRAEGAPPSSALGHAVCAIGEAMSAAALGHWNAIPQRALTLRDDCHEEPSHTSPLASNVVPEWIAQAIAVLARCGTPAPSAIQPDAAAEPMATRFGGLLLLLRDLEACPWTLWTAGWPMLEALAPATVLRWLIVGACAGRRRAVEATHDAVLRMFFDISADLTIADVAVWLRHVGPVRRAGLARHLAGPDEPAVHLSRAARAWLTMPRASGVNASWSTTLAGAASVVLGRFAHRLPGFAESTPEHLSRNFLDFDAMAEPEPDRVVVYCGRPPLHLMLTLTGMTRGLMAGHDARGRPWLLFARD